MKYLLFVLTIFLSSCSVKSNKDIKILDKNQFDSIWFLEKLEGKMIDLNQLNERPTIEINIAKMTINGNDGCNQYGGKINQFNHSKLVFGSIMTTEMACPNMDIPFAMGRLMGEVSHYELKYGNLKLLNEHNIVLMEFTKKDTETPSKNRLHDIWVLKKIEGKPYNHKLVNKQPILEFNVVNLKVMGNDGCNSINGKIKELTDSKLVFGPILGTKMACPNMIVSYKFNQSLEKVVAYKMKGLSLFLLDENGVVLMELGKVD